MLNISNINALRAQGFSFNEMGSIPDDQTAQAVQEYIKGGMTKEDVIAYVKSSASAKVTTKRKGEVETNPEHVLETSDGVLNKDVNFGGMQGTKFVVWNDTLALSNPGTGGRPNSMFITLGKNGKLELPNVLARLDLMKKVLKSHETACNIAEEYFKAKAVELGIL